MLGHEECRWLLGKEWRRNLFRPGQSRRSPCKRRGYSRTERFFGWPGLPVDQACDTPACDTEHYSKSLVPIAKVAWRSPVEFLQSFDITGEVAAVVREIPNYDG